LNTSTYLKLFIIVFGVCATLPTFANKPSDATTASEQHQYGKFSYAISEDLPDWVSPLKAKKSKGKPEGQGAEYVLIDTQVLAEHGNYQKYYASSTYLHTNQAVSENSEIHVSFNPLYQKLVLHDVSVVREGKRNKHLKPDNIRLLQREEDLRNGIYDGIVTAIIIIPNTRVGDRVDSRYTITGRNPVYGEKVFGAYTMGWSVDVGFTRIRLLVPKHIAIQTRAHNAKLKLKKKSKGRYNEYIWQKKSIAGRLDEGDYPAWFTRYPSSWEEVEAWAATLYTSIDQNSEELSEKINHFKQQSSNQADYASQSLKFTQDDNRYLGLEFGQNSHLPHSPAHVLENRYGDCKDKSNVLVQMLKANGIESYPALVSNQYRQGFTHFLPSPLAFDHVIVLAKVNGEEVWLDPTRTYQTSDIDNLGFTHFGKSLVIGSDHQSPIVDVTPLKSQGTKTQLTEHFKISSPKKPAKLVVETIYEGQQAEFQRYYFASNTTGEIQNQYHNFYSKIYPNIQIDKDLEFHDDIKNNVFSVKEFYLVRDFIKSENDIHTAIFYASSIDQNVRSPNRVLRDSPIDIGAPQNIRHKIIVDFAKNIGINIDSTPYIKTLPEFEFRSRSAYFSKRFEYEADLYVKKSSIEHKDVETYVGIVNEIKKNIDFSLSFKHPYTPKTSISKRQLVKSLEALKLD